MMPTTTASAGESPKETMFDGEKAGCGNASRHQRYRNNGLCLNLRKLKSLSSWILILTESDDEPSQIRGLLR
jgi:hypothetical protein